MNQRSALVGFSPTSTRANTSIDVHVALSELSITYGDKRVI